MSGEPDAMAALAEALGVARHQLAIAAGSLRRAEELARGFAERTRSIDEIMEALDMYTARMGGEIEARTL